MSEQDKSSHFAVNHFCWKSQLILVRLWICFSQGLFNMLRGHLFKHTHTTSALSPHTLVPTPTPTPSHKARDVSWIMHPWGKGGHLDLLWFPVTQMCVGIHLHPSESVCARLCLRDISYNFSPMAFKFLDVVTMDKTLNSLPFCDYDSIFKVIGGHYVSKLTLFMLYFLQFTNGFNFSDMVTMDKTLNLLTFCDYGSIVKVTWGHVSTLTLFTRYFL